VFTFVAQHTVHLTYNSLRPELRNVESWSVVSSFSIIIAAILSLALGISVYLTFWEETTSRMFELYPPLASVDVAKVLLSVMMMLTYPLALFSCRELIITSIPIPKEDVEFVPIIISGQKAWWLLPHDDKQLIRSLHVMVTVALWGISTELAIRAPSLGDVLNVVGCVAGTVIAYFLPGLFDIKVNGYSHVAMLLLVVGTSVGLVGTYSSLAKLFND
jgi:amino acid permease